MYCTNRISAEKNEFSVTPASSSTDRRHRASRPRRERVDDCRGEQRAGEAGERYRRERAERSRRVLNVMTRIAPSAAPADTPSVNGVASGLRSSACMTTPAAASVAPTTAPVSTRGMPGDEEDLRVDVVGKRNRAIERAREADVRAADERREHARGDGERAVAGDRPRRAAPRIGCPVRGPDSGPCRAVESMRAHRDSAAPESPSGGRRADETARPRPRRTTAGPLRQSAHRRGALRQHPAAAHQRPAGRRSEAARFRSCVASTIVTLRSRLRRASSAAISS